MTECVVLRPVAENDLPVLQMVTQDPQSTGEFEWAGWYDPRAWERGWAENGLIGPEGGVLMVIRGGEQLGLVSYRRNQTGPATHCWETGIALIPAAAGHGYGTEAQRLLVRYLFAHTTVNRIEASTDVGNIAEQRSLEKCGFTREGVRRGFRWRDGAWRDELLYSILRADMSA